MSNPNLVTVRDGDSRLMALAELVHQLHPSWDREGVRSALHRARTGRRTLRQLVDVAIDAAFDPAAQTPAAIGHTARWDRPARPDQPPEKPTWVPPPFRSDAAGVPPTDDFRAARDALRGGQA